MAYPILPSRRALLLGAAASSLAARPAKHDPAFLNLSRPPDMAAVETESSSMILQKHGASWQSSSLEVLVEPVPQGVGVQLLAPTDNVLRIHLRWQCQMPSNLLFLGDQWERSYGDLGWRTMDPDRILPWYLLAFDGASTFACGVKTGAAAFCFWQVDPAGVSLWLDVRNGGRGVSLGKRKLPVATVVTRHYPDTQPFAAACRFCRLLSDMPRLPAAPVYGGNNWYYAYGKSSAGAIRDDSERIAALSPSTANRPFMVIDDGWAPNATAGPWSTGNSLFPDMAKLASDMRARSVRPGLWIRPLFTKESVPEGWRLNSPNAAREYNQRQGYTLDPTVPEAAARIASDLQTAVRWGYELIKHDFSTYDLLGRWGNHMNAEITDKNWSFSDRSVTSAEVIRNFYQTVRDAAGEAMLLGCNTVGHLSAGLFEISRTGDDTSGRDWNRTRKMGINTLAFRGPQHGSFYAIDADCVGITKQISWSYNRQWLDLLANSGTPLFVSAAPDALGHEQRLAIQEALAKAATSRPVIEPLDWLTNTQPEHWLASRKALSYDWFGREGSSPATA